MTGYSGKDREWGGGEGRGGEFVLSQAELGNGENGGRVIGPKRKSMHDSHSIV